MKPFLICIAVLAALVLALFLFWKSIERKDPKSEMVKKTKEVLDPIAIALRLKSKKPEESVTPPEPSVNPPEQPVSPSEQPVSPVNASGNINGGGTKAYVKKESKKPNNPEESKKPEKSAKPDETAVLNELEISFGVYDADEASGIRIVSGPVSVDSVFDMDSKKGYLTVVGRASSINSRNGKTEDGLLVDKENYVVFLHPEDSIDMGPLEYTFISDRHFLIAKDKNCYVLEVCEDNTNETYWHEGFEEIDGEPSPIGELIPKGTQVNLFKSKLKKGIVFRVENNFVCIRSLKLFGEMPHKAPAAKPVKQPVEMMKPVVSTQTGTVKRGFTRTVPYNGEN